MKYKLQIEKLKQLKMDGNLAMTNQFESQDEGYTPFEMELLNQITELKKVIDKKTGREIALEKMLIEHQEFSQWLEEQMDNMTTEKVHNFIPNLYNKTYKLNHD